jgi:hypothetical protein
VEQGPGSRLGVSTYPLWSSCAGTFGSKLYCAAGCRRAVEDGTMVRKEKVRHGQAGGWDHELQRSRCAHMPVETGHVLPRDHESRKHIYNDP